MYDCRFDWDVFKSLMELPTDQTLILEDCWLRCNTSTLLDTINVLGGKKNMKIQKLLLELFAILHFLVLPPTTKIGFGEMK